MVCLIVLVDVADVVFVGVVMFRAMVFGIVIVCVSE